MSANNVGLALDSFQVRVFDKNSKIYILEYYVDFKIF
jgi:hypothetical protein